MKAVYNKYGPPDVLQIRDDEKPVPRDNALGLDEDNGARYDVEAVRADFPVLHRPVRGLPLVYLDTAASAQKPTQVIEAERSENQRSHK